MRTPLSLFMVQVHAIECSHLKTDHPWVVDYAPLFGAPTLTPCLRPSWTASSGRTHVTVVVWGGVSTPQSSNGGYM